LGRGAASNSTEAEHGAGVTTFLDTNILARHLTGDPPALVARATRYLHEAPELLLPDLILAEVVYVLESFYEVPRERVAAVARSILAFDAITVVDRDLLLRTLELYEVERLWTSPTPTWWPVPRSLASFEEASGGCPPSSRVEPPRV
jgi:predicted nucleic-acid-binding protein